MWANMKDKIAREHIQLRNELRQQFQREQGTQADLLYESSKLFKPITESTKKIEKALIESRKPEPEQIDHLTHKEEKQPMEIAPDYAIIDPDYGLDVEMLEEMGFVPPSKIKDVDLYDDIIEDVNHYNKYVLGRAKRGSTSEQKDTLSQKINTNREYVKRLRLLMSGQKLLVGKEGIPFKLIGNKFGNLTVDTK